MEILVAKSCPTLWDPMNCSLPDSSDHGILQTRILVWVAIPFSGGSSQSRDGTQVSCFTGRYFTLWAPKWVSDLLLIVEVNHMQPFTFSGFCLRSCKPEPGIVPEWYGPRSPPVLKGNYNRKSWTFLSFPLIFFWVNLHIFHEICPWLKALMLGTS